MKKISPLIIILFYAQSALAQFNPLLYDWTSHPSSALYAPQTYTHHRFYLGIPALSHFQISFQNNGFTAYDLFGANNENFNKKWQNVLYNLKSSHGFLLHIGEQILDFGWKNDFSATTYHAGLRFDAEAFGFHPVSFYRFALYGNPGGQGVLELNDINFNAEAFYTLYFGFSRSNNPSFHYGMNFKIYNSAGNISSAYNNGKIYSIEGQNNYYTHVFENIRFDMRSSGVSMLVEKDKIGTKKVNKNQVQADLISRFLGTSDFGAGMDFGFEKIFNARLSYTFSILDLGFIYYNSDVFRIHSEGSYRYEGVHVEYPDTPKDYWEEIRTDFKQSVKTDTTRNGYIHLRPTRIYTSMKWTFIPDKEHETTACRDISAPESKPKLPPSLSFVGFYQNLQGHAYLGTGIVWEWHPTAWLDTRLSYTFDNYIQNNISVAIQWRIGHWYWFLTAENIMGLTDLGRSNGQRIQIGTYLAF